MTEKKPQKRDLPRVEHSRKAPRTSTRFSFGNALATTIRCRQTAAVPANFGLRVLQASKNGLTNTGRLFRSLSKSVCQQHLKSPDRPAAICASDVLGRALRSYNDFSAACIPRQRSWQ